MTTLADFSKRFDVLNVACQNCDRKGCYQVSGLIEKYGDDFTLPNLPSKLAVDCPKFKNVWASDRCQVYFPDLR